tara:strand:- start:290534 stop:292159 length:1626 start_codon:yes stop_codon:yes gene_type:complete
MADHIQIGDVVPRVSYTADAVTTAFTYPFPIFKETDLSVYVDGTLQGLGSDYTVSGAGASAGGSTNFASAPSAGALVAIVRQLSVKRTSDFQSSGEFRANVINDELDFLTAALQQVDDKVSRTVHLSASDASSSLVLPTSIERVNRVIGFDVDGDLVMHFPNEETYITLSSFAVSLADDVDATEARATLGVQAKLDLPSQTEAESGIATLERAWSAERVKQAITALSTGEDDVARDMASSALAYAMAQNDATSIAGSIGQFYFSDDFEGDSLVTKANATYDVAGDFYSNPADDIIVSGATGSAQGTGASPANAFDGATGTYVSLIDGQNVGKDYGSATGKRISKVYISNGDGGTNWVVGSAPTIQFTLRASNSSFGDAGGANLGTVLFTDDSGVSAHTINSNDTLNAYRYIWVERGGSSTCTIATVDFFEVTDSANMVLSPSIATLTTTSPPDILAYIVIAPQESITIGTDIAMTMSIDGGTTNATGMWTKVGDIGSDGKQLWRVEADVSAQSGASLTYEITTANNKEIRLHACVGLVTIY